MLMCKLLTQKEFLYDFKSLKNINILNTISFVTKDVLKYFWLKLYAFYKDCVENFVVF